MITLKAVNKALKARGYVDELFKGEGYYYFWGDCASLWYTSNVPVFRLNHIPTVDRWVAIYELMKRQYEDS